MKERPILFSGPMVRAILDEGKTQTRRIINPQLQVNSEISGTWLWKTRPRSTYWIVVSSVESISIFCPYGQPGDRLWVKETFASLEGVGIKYRADKSDPSHPPSEHWDIPWKPSIFMPLKLSRITLEIVGLRVERIQSISHEDCIAEGCFGGPYAIPNYGFSATPREHYRHVWKTINGDKSWDSNPWVWVIEFKKV